MWIGDRAGLDIPQEFLKTAMVGVTGSSLYGVHNEPLQTGKALQTWLTIASLLLPPLLYLSNSKRVARTLLSGNSSATTQ